MKNKNRRYPGYEDKWDVSAEEYMRLEEDEKDLVVEQTLIRLQNRIHAILHFLEIEAKTEESSPPKENKG